MDLTTPLLVTTIEARRAGKTVPVFCSETRPYLQGARLTAFSVQQIGHPVTVIRADRVCLDGTVCNKIGTYQFALAAHANAVPY